MYFDILILSTLRRRPAHGYEIKKHVSRVNGGAVSVNNNVLYPALRRFEKAGAIERLPDVEGSASGRPPRTVYRLTASGEQELRRMLEEADPAIVADDAEFKIRVSLFAEVPPVVRRQLLARRRQFVEQRRAHMVEMHGLPTVGTASWAARVLDYNLEQLEAELDWLEALEAVAEQDQPAEGRSKQLSAGSRKEKAERGVQDR